MYDIYDLFSVADPEFSKSVWALAGKRRFKIALFPAITEKN
jgi:hypothetical protein